MEVVADEGSTRSEFTGPVYLEIVDAKSQTKPLTQLQVINAVREQVGLEGVKSVEVHDRESPGSSGFAAGEGDHRSARN